MNPLTTVLTLPISGPLGALTWIARQIANAATQQLLDPARIETALLLLERRLEDGQIDEATFDIEEEKLLQELAEITAMRAAEASALTEDPDEADEAVESEPALEPAALQEDLGNAASQEADAWTPV